MKCNSLSGHTFIAEAKREPKKPLHQLDLSPKDQKQVLIILSLLDSNAA